MFCHAAPLTGQDNHKTGVCLSHLAFQLIVQTNVPCSCLLSAFRKVVTGMLKRILAWESNCLCSLPLLKLFLYVQIMGPN